MTAPAGRLPTRLGFWALAALAAANMAVVVVMWAHGGNVTRVHSSGDLVTSVARLTGLLGAQSALLQVLLLARLPWLERAVGFDRLTVWHRWNGHTCLYLVLAHVVFSIWGYALLDRLPLTDEVSTMIWGGVYPGMILATVSTALFLGVVATSIAVAKRRLRHELWHGVHLASYAAIALSWAHQIPTGNELVIDRLAAAYWRGLYLATLVALVGFRVVVPAVNAFRYRLRVAEVVEEGGGAVSVRLTGRNLDRLDARAGQFFLWRFLTRRTWWEAHPFSLSAAPDGRSLRITVKALGDFTRRLASLPVGTRVVAEGPFGVFTAASRRAVKTLLVGGGIGIAPIRALLEEMPGDVAVIYRVASHDDLVLEAELRELAASRSAALHVVVGDHRTEAGRALLSAERLRALVPDLGERDVFVCGPPAMADAAHTAVRDAGVPRSRIHTERFAL
ncbi:MAG: ferredoxin reductase family protein [Gaiellales bacterium]